MTDTSLQELLARGLEVLGLSEEPSGPLAELAKLLEQWSENMSLTAHRGAEAIARRLVLDAAAMERQLPPAPTILDIGSGPGFPGLVLGLLRPAAVVTLLESRERPHHFQRAAVRALQLANVLPLRGRAEELPAEAHALVVAQAVAQPAAAAGLGIPWTAPGGHLVLAGSASPPQLARPAALGPPRILRYRVPLGGPERTLWVAQRLESG